MMRMVGWLGGMAVLSALMFSASVMAFEGTIEGVAIRFPAPEGFCELKNDNPNDKRQIDLTSAANDRIGNRHIGVSAECQQLFDWRAHKRKFLDDFADYVTLKASAAATQESFQATCDDVKANGEKILSQQKSDLKKNIEELSKTIKVNEIIFSGYFGQDAKACYGALLKKLAIDSTEKTLITLFAYTIVRGKSVFLYRTAPFVNTDATSKLLDKLKDTVATLHAVNPS